jgi:hypothetical protein
VCPNQSDAIVVKSMDSQCFGCLCGVSASPTLWLNEVGDLNHTIGVWRAIKAALANDNAVISQEHVESENPRVRVNNPG